MSITVQPHGPTNEFLSKVATWPQFLQPAECEALVRLAEGYQAKDGTIGSRYEGNRDIRKSEVWFLAEDESTRWVFERFAFAIGHVNQGYQFELEGIDRGVQIARYVDRGHYDWHIDVGTAELSRRKLSISVQLSDPSTYDGGDLQFHMPNLDTAKMRGQGALIAFPSYLEHRVAPVTRGVRYSLVAWIAGPPFR